MPSTETASETASEPTTVYVSEHTPTWEMLPPPINNRSFATIEEAIDWIGEWAAIQGYGISKGHSWRNTQGIIPKVRFRCQRGQGYRDRRRKKSVNDTTPSRNTTHLSTDCPFAGELCFDFFSRRRKFDGDGGGIDDPCKPEPSFRRAASASPSAALAEGTASNSHHAVTRWHCDAGFSSRNKLHSHLKDAAHITEQQPSSFKTTIGEDGDADSGEYKPIIESDRKRHSSTPGRAYRAWRFLSTVAGLGSPNNKIKICLDSGCLMTIINSDLASSLHLQYHDTPDIPVAGIGSKHVSSKFIDLPVLFHGEHNIAKIMVEAYMVDNL
ncbi:hypothetical protein N7465_003208 [Penicillium sp. CMV-2018d]|nr:hypothetical protein N7465_003208 [Penicillium sp. CMV-2018d]